MPINTLNSKLYISGTVTAADLISYAQSNPTLISLLATGVVEFKNRVVILDSAELNTSGIHVVTNHQLYTATSTSAGENATTNTGIWRITGGTVTVKGTENEFGDKGPVLRWYDVQINVDKSAGYYAPWRAQPGNPSAQMQVENVRYYIRDSGVGVDGILAMADSTSIVKNITFVNNDTVTPGNGIGLVGSDSVGWQQSGTPFYHVDGLAAGFHEGLGVAGTELQINFRRNCGGAVFYRPVNTLTGNRISSLRYAALGASAGHGSRSIIVGAYKPTLLDGAGAPVSGVSFWVIKSSDSSIECKGTTGADGKPSIVNGSANSDERSIDNTFVVSGTAYPCVRYHAGVKYVRQAIVPATTGANVVSVDQGTFKVVQRKLGYQEIIATQSFADADYDGSRIMLSDAYYTSATSVPSGVQINASTKSITLTTATTLDQLYDYTRCYLIAQPTVSDWVECFGDNISIGDWNIIGAEFLTAGTKLINLSTTGNITCNNAPSSTLKVNATIIITTGINVARLSANTRIDGLPTTGPISTGGKLGFGSGTTINATGDMVIENTEISGTLTINTAVARSITLKNCTGQLTGINKSGAGTLQVKISGRTASAITGTLGTGVTKGVIVKVEDSAGGSFTILGVRGDTGAKLSYTADATSVEFFIEQGVSVKIGAWKLGKNTFYKEIATTNGGSDNLIDFIANDAVNTTIDVTTILAGIDVSLTPTDFSATFNNALSIDIEQMKAALHRVFLRETSLNAVIAAGTSPSIEILADEIKVNKPILFLRAAPSLATTDRVELNGFFNTTNAKTLNPAYVINPSNTNGKFVQVLAVKPTVDYALLSQSVQRQMENDIQSITRNTNLIPAIL